MSRTLLSPLLLLIALATVSYAWNSQTVESGPVDTSTWEIEAVRGEDLEPLDIRFMARGYFHARSAFPDLETFGGHGQSDNEPRRLRHDLPRGRLLLIARPEQGVAFDSRYEGFQVTLANTTRRAVRFDAVDSRLSIVREALDRDGRWRPIEYLPSSWCGNSYHRVFLPPNHYWSFEAPRYSGSEETTMRFALEIDGGAGPVYSNEFAGTVNPEQFLVKQGHTPTSLMDPYLD